MPAFKPLSPSSGTWFRKSEEAGGGLKWGKIAGVGAGGVAAWSLLDKNAGAKIGDAASNVGSSVGNLFSGLGSGLVGGLFRPEFLSSSCSSCILSSVLLVVFFLVRH
jgi:hypothetical protein